MKFLKFVFRSLTSYRAERSPEKPIKATKADLPARPRPVEQVRRSVQVEVSVETAEISETTLSGPCYVIDGDTIVIAKTRIRLWGIDAPEIDHPWGQKSKWTLVGLCKGQQITAKCDGNTSHDRLVAKCYLPDGTDLSAEMVRRGMAIDWPKFSGGAYATLEPVGIRKKLWRAHSRQRGRATA